MGGGSDLGGGAWMERERMRKDSDKAERQKRLAETRKTSAAKARENKPKKVERVKL